MKGEELQKVRRICRKVKYKKLEDKENVKARKIKD